MVAVVVEIGICCVVDGVGCCGAAICGDGVTVAAACCCAVVVTYGLFVHTYDVVVEVADDDATLRVDAVGVYVCDITRGHVPVVALIAVVMLSLIMVYAIYVVLMLLLFRLLTLLLLLLRLLVTLLRRLVLLVLLLLM